MPAGLLLDETCEVHQPGPGHPERPSRLQAVRQALERAGVLEQARRIPARAAVDDELLLAHEPEYVALVLRETAARVETLSTGDTALGGDSLLAARHAAGGVIEAVDAVCAGRVDRAFCVVRPPGHHASADRGMGFCLFNNVAIAARYAQKRHSLERCAIIDWDVHHGNGTQDIFYGDGSVFFFSTHQSPWYPGTGSAAERGEGEGAGSTLNCPLPAGTGMEEIRRAFVEQLGPALRRFRPDLLLISAGFDSREGDPLGSFRLKDEDFAELTLLAREWAEDLCGGRLISVLEGGYNLRGLASAALSHWRALQD